VFDSISRAKTGLQLDEAGTSNLQPLPSAATFRADLTMPGTQGLKAWAVLFGNFMPTTALQRPENRSQIHNRLVLTNSVSAFCQQSGLNRSQIVKVEHLFGDRVDQDLAKLKEKR
jgi:hypothetical protein